MRTLFIISLSALLAFNFSSCSSVDEMENVTLETKEQCVGTFDFIADLKQELPLAVVYFNQ